MGSDLQIAHGVPRRRVDRVTPDAANLLVRRLSLSLRACHSLIGLATAKIRRMKLDGNNAIELDLPSEICFVCSGHPLPARPWGRLDRHRGLAVAPDPDRAQRPQR